MNTEVVVTCAVTGSGDTVGKHPAIPVTPEQIAGAAIEAAQGRGGGRAHPCPRPADRQGRPPAGALPRGGGARARLGRGRDPQPHRRHGRRLRPGRRGALARRGRHRHGLGRRPAGPCRGAAARDLHARLRQHELRHVGLCQHARHAPRHGRPDQGRGRQARDGGVRARPCLAGEDAGRGGADRGAASVPALHGHPLRCRGRPARGARDARPAAARCRVRRLRHRPDADADGGPGRADGRPCPGRARGQSLARQGGLRVERRPRHPGLRDRAAHGRPRPRPRRGAGEARAEGRADGRPQGRPGRRRGDRRRLGGAADRERASTSSCAIPTPKSSARSARCWPTPTAPMPS